jgi:hypothetical protein
VTTRLLESVCAKAAKRPSSGVFARSESAHRRIPSAGRD